MQEKDRLLKKINFLIFFFVLLISKNLIAENIINKINTYNLNLKNSSASFIQTNEKGVEEGKISFGEKRIRVDYILPQKITLIVSNSKGIYINHELRESQFFNTKKSYIKVFFNIFLKEIEQSYSNINSERESITLSENIFLDGDEYLIKIVYENNPVLLRKIEITNIYETLKIGLFDHKIKENFDVSFFSMADPYLE